MTRQMTNYLDDLPTMVPTNECTCSVVPQQCSERRSTPTQGRTRCRRSERRWPPSPTVLERESRRCDRDSAVAPHRRDRCGGRRERKNIRSGRGSDRERTARTRTIDRSTGTVRCTKEKFVDLLCHYFVVIYTGSSSSGWKGRGECICCRRK